MKTARILSLFLALLMLLSVFVACGDKPEESSGVETKTPVGDGNGRDDEADTVPTNLNYNGETVTFLVRGGSNMNQYELACENLINDPVYDAIHYRNIDVESRLGVKVKAIAQNGEFPWTDWLNTVSVSVLTNTGDYDGCAFYLSVGTALAKEGIYYNLLELTQDEGGYFNFNKPWWNDSMVDDLSVYGALFFTGGSLTMESFHQGLLKLK
ncbi:MAG: hypothetical protein J6B12_05260 [Clostridia bacterium]|nr:hypothetical protein [Clostridia bacterium]